VQQGLFDQPIEFDPEADPYVAVRSASTRLAAEYAISEDEAFDMILGYGSEAAARRTLRQRWWLGHVELREAKAA
jgi:hypothetical protein